MDHIMSSRFPFKLHFRFSSFLSSSHYALDPPPRTDPKTFLSSIHGVCLRRQSLPSTLIPLQYLNERGQIRGSDKGLWFRAVDSGLLRSPHNFDTAGEFLIDCNGGMYTGRTRGVLLRIDLGQTGQIKTVNADNNPPAVSRFLLWFLIIDSPRA